VTAVTDQLSCLFLAAALMLLTGCGGSDAGRDTTGSAPASAPETAALSVELVATMRPPNRVGLMSESGDGSRCGPSPILDGALAAWSADAEVTVRDAAGELVADSVLGAGETDGYAPHGEGFTFTCTWRLEVEVPPSGFYTVTVAGSEAGTVDSDGGRVDVSA
jgi:hypothetical protein